MQGQSESSSSSGSFRPGSFRKVVVLGAGTMGHGIAQVCAAAGYTTTLFDIEQPAVDRGLARVAQNLDKGVARGKVSAEQRDATLQQLSGSADFDAAVVGAELVIEAVPESISLKQRLFADATRVAGDEVVLATNTSSLSIDTIAAAVPRPERVIGTHFFNPVHIMKLLEIVVGQRTSASVLAAIQGFGARIGKTCITVRDSPGFATSRLGLVIGLEAIRMVEEGVASPADIDTAMCLGYGFPMGPLRLTDLVGLDVRLSIADYLSEQLEQGAHFKPPALLRQMVA
ncbi:MAG: 3-hydroxyacyl-CoA dehydrogenase family protein, partial [Myxococcales bacterium]|nr:3-hydroxyacyl-CoA dehydrogenase family protein [Myxococcales bacterium]